MTFNPYVLLCNIYSVLRAMNQYCNEYNDLLTLQAIIIDLKDCSVLNADVLLKMFRDFTHVRVSIEDLYVYFSNLGVFKSE